MFLLNALKPRPSSLSEKCNFFGNSLMNIYAIINGY